jgi:tRNA(Ile)-lysidine synthase
MEKVKQFIYEKALIEKGDHIVIGFSGGPDSVYLLKVLCELREELELSILAVHVNHQLREEAWEDQAFAEDLCREWEVPLKVFSADVTGLAQKEKMTLEEAGRKIRYEIFNKELSQNGKGKIAVAHHKNDQAETFLFRITRGTGLEGAGAMKPKDGVLIRPLLCIGKEEIRGKLRSLGQPWKEDPSNRESVYSRNRLRNIVIPEMEKINVQTVEHISALTQDIQEAMEYLKKNLQKIYQRIVVKNNQETRIDGKLLKHQDIWMQKQVLKKALEETAGRKKDIQKCHVEDLLALFEKESGKRISLPYEMTAEKVYDEVCLWQGVKKTKSMFRGTLIQEQLTDLVNISENDCIKIIDYDKIDTGVVLRCRQPGDFFMFGDDGRKKSLNRYFIDEKIPREFRDRIPLAADGSRIIWIIGERLSSYYRVSEQTKKYLKLQFKREGDESLWRTFDN